MTADYLGLIELVLVGGIVMGLAIWELVRVRRSLAQSRRSPTDEAKKP